MRTQRSSWQRQACHGAPGAAWNRKRPQPTGAPPIGRLSPCCSRVACAGRKRRRCAGRTCRTRPTGRGIVVYVRRSKTDQDGTAADVRYLKNGCAAGASPAPRPAHRAAVRVASGWHRPGARRHQRPVHRTAPHGSGQRRRHRGANHRALRAGRPCRRIDQARRTGARRRPRRAGGSRHGWSPTTRRPSQPSRAPSLGVCRIGLVSLSNVDNIRPL